MKTRTLHTAVAGLAIAGILALTGCANGPTTPEVPDATRQGSDAAASFLACLTASGIEAKITDSGQVAVKADAQLGEGGAISSGDGALGTEGDDEGNTWVIPVDAGYFADDAETQDAYAACETEHPNFSQPEANSFADDPELAEDQKGQEDAALTFARCARANGYAQVEDPDFSQANALQIPVGLTEAEFRALLGACWDREGPVFNFGQPLDAPFEAGTVLDEFLNTPAS